MSDQKESAYQYSEYDRAFAGGCTCFWSIPTSGSNHGRVIMESRAGCPVHDLAKKSIPGLTALQASADANRKHYEAAKPDAKVLESFPTPRPNTAGANMMVRITAPEFTSVCPLTAQPDFANIIVRYVPADKCVESKSFKLYLLGYRNHGAFHESVIRQIGDDLVTLLDPKQLEVIGEFTPRGGIAFHPTYFYLKPDIK